jgi:hypothetical protein
VNPLVCLQVLLVQADARAGHHSRTTHATTLSRTYVKRAVHALSHHNMAAQSCASLLLPGSSEIDEAAQWRISQDGGNIRICTEQLLGPFFPVHCSAFGWPAAIKSTDY